VTATSKWILDIHPDDVYWCMADIGWITGIPTSSTVAGERGDERAVRRRADVSDAGRPWRIAERLRVNIFHTAPTAIRMLRKLGPRSRASTNTTSVDDDGGEPIEPEAWRWYYDEVGKRKP